ncbi:HD-like signal output (HDOD) domain, no enzymatic activity [endosymbiont of Ridgeia piscesae]|jgi:HD-like signal output (HDOD) protein|uniref:HD-like signal output (HDOD) domain, no enzymatic activity n=2 Tax=endosymbiont of Ridgeia piscesae TaxID=54398 RepID=A0A0T5YV71_9GAMM|nr:HD-like signal output (HDOD) domain, no enzymatic activity [endosymbiont of Ridgeia piscesae]KRT59188.1 HD-like signal output (HDOD) domain, no enzymatic activity [endosymbiont of Ridgeia piscesae]
MINNMARSLSVARPLDLKEFNPLWKLPDRVAPHIASEAIVEHLVDGDSVIKAGSQSSEITFLMQGEVEFVQQDGKRAIYTANSERCAYPLSVRIPHQYDITARGAITILKLERDIVLSISKLPDDSSEMQPGRIELKESGGPEAKLYWELFEATKSGKLQLPSMPSIATRIAKVVNNADTDSNDIARVIQADPTIAARLISVVNSAAYRGRSKINSLPDAITRLGHNVTHNLVISFALHTLFHSSFKALNNKLRSTWQHSCYVAPVCHELGRITPGMSPDRALLIGLVHNIGTLPIINASRGYPELTDNPQLLDQTINNLRHEIGAMVLRKWGFENDFVQAALHADDWMRDPQEKPDYTDLLLIARLHSYVGSPRMDQLPRLDLLPAYHKLALGRLTPRHSLAILQHAKAEIRDLRQLLSNT